MHASHGHRCRMIRIIGIVLASTVAIACRSPSTTARRKLSVGIQASPAMAMVMVANQRGLFSEQGLDVELELFTAGKFALQALIGGSLDLAVCGDVPIALATLQGNDLHVVAQVVANTTDEVRVVARRDPEAVTAAEFFTSKRRKLATSIGGGPEFYTYNFLKKYRIASGDIEIVNQRPEDMPATLLRGSVDAISVFDPFAFIAESRLGSEGITYRNDGLYSELYVLAVTKDLVGSAEIDAVLRALKSASAVMRDRPDDARAIVAAYTRLEQPVVDGIWPTFDFRLVLDRSLLELWDAEAAWARETGKVPMTAKANFASVIAEDALRRLDPAAVHLE